MVIIDIYYAFFKNKVPECEDFAATPNGAVSGTETAYIDEETRIITCMTGFRVDGPKDITCNAAEDLNSAMWSTPPADTTCGKCKSFPVFSIYILIINATSEYEHGCHLT